MSWTWLIEVCGWEKILLEGPQANAPYTYPIVMVLLGCHGPSNPFPCIWFCFQPLLGHHRTSTLSTQRCYSPNSSFVGPFFSLLALFLVKLSLQALQILLRGLQFLQDVQVCSRFSEMQDMHFVKTGILCFKAKWWHDSGLKVYMGYSTVQLKSSRGKPVAIELHYTVDQQNHSDLL